MAAYLIVRVFKVNDPEQLAAYRKAVPATIAAHGGKVLAAGNPVRTFEGAEETARTLIIEYPDRAAAEGWFDSSEYQALFRAREGAMDAQIVLIDGA